MPNICPIWQPIETADRQVPGTIRGSPMRAPRRLASSTRLGVENVQELVSARPKHHTHGANQLGKLSPARHGECVRFELWNWLNQVNRIYQLFPLQMFFRRFCSRCVHVLQVGERSIGGFL
jgi:hypothetical protein